MAKINLIWIIGLLCLAPAFADMNKDLQHVWVTTNASTNATHALDQVGNIPLILNTANRCDDTAIFGTTGVSCDSDDALGYIYNDSLAMYGGSFSVSIQMKSIKNQNSDYDCLLRWQKTTGSFDAMSLYVSGYDPNIYNKNDIDGVDAEQTINNFNYALNVSLHNIVYVCENAVSSRVYVDGVLKNTSVQTTFCGNMNQSGKLYIGSNAAAGEIFNGKFSNIYMWNRSLDASEVLSLNASATGEYPFAGPPGTNFSITAVNNFTGAALTKFNASVDGNYYTTLAEQINTTLPSNSSSLYNIYVNKSGFYDLKYLNWNVSENLRASFVPFALESISQFPTNNSQFNVTPIEINTTIRYNGTPVTTNCRMNITSDTTSFTNLQTQTNVNKTIFYSNSSSILTSAPYQFWWFCDNNYLSLSTGKTNLYMDLVSPNINTTFLNNSLFYISNNITGVFNFTDNMNITKYETYLDGILIDNSSIILSTFYQYNLSHNLTYLSTGSSHSLFITTSDGQYGTMLNTVSRNYTFNIFNYSLIYNLAYLESIPQVIYLNITTPTTNVSATYNGTPQTVISDSTKLYHFSYTSPILGYNRDYFGNWSFKVNGINYDANFTQTVQAIGISNCSNASWAKALIFTFNDENNVNSSQINSTLNIHMTIWTGDPDTYTQLNASYSGAQNYSICISPNEAVYNMTAIMQYSATNFQTRGYYMFNATLSNITQVLPLQHILSSLSGLVTTNVYETGSSILLPGSYVYMLRYYPETNSYRVVEVEQTDPSANAIFSVIPYNTFYKFLVRYNDQIYIPKNSGIGQTVSTGSLSLPITISDSSLYSLTRIGDVAGTTTCNPTTLTCQFTWLDVEGLVATAYFDVYRTDGWGRTRIYNASASTPSGTLMYTIAENTTGRNYYAVGSVETSTKNSFYVLSQAELLAGGSLFGSLGDLNTVLFSGFVLVLTLALLLIDVGPVGIVIGIMAGLLAGSVLGIIPLMLGGIIAIGAVFVIGIIYGKG